MKKSIILTFLITSIFVIKLSYAQQYLISYFTPFKYFSATEEPDKNWYMPDYDDSSWPQDTGTIGFGYNNLDVQVENGTYSLYIRYKFNIENKSGVKEVNLFADFDDGYIAYLNGTEILRVNINDTIEALAYKDIAERSHERETAPYPVLGYYFDFLVLDTLLVQGENTLAVHVLNDSLNGSDIYFSGNLFDITNTQYNLWADPWRYKRKCKLDSTDFPIVIINTDEFGIPNKHIRVKAYMGVFDNGSDNYNYPADSCNVYERDVSIEVRGESSGEFSKRSYRFETIDSTEKDTNAVMLGMPSDNDWILFGPFHDKSQFRNKMIFDLGARLGSYQPRSRFCELILNGEYVGLYCLSETIVST